jgi:myo-inositol 2-dehydrogenase/D-chiro-inositol 1-dehydrogenase
MRDRAAGAREVTVKIALLGAGRIGKMHAAILAGVVGGDQLLVSDGDEEAAAAVAAANGAAAVPVDEAIERADAVAIAAASDVHGDLIRKAIGLGKPTFCEKPLAPGLEESRELVALIEGSGVPFMLGFQRRFDPAYVEARRLIESGEMGTVYAIRLAGHDPAPPHEAYIPASGGLFRDFSIHDWDVIRWLTGSEVAEVYAVGAVRGFEVFGKYDDVDTAIAAITMANGVLAVLTTARHDPLGYDIRTEIFGSKDSVVVGLGPRTPIRSLEPDWVPSDARKWDFFIDRFMPAYEAEIAAFVRVARGEIPTPCTARDGLQALIVADAATLSRKEHRPVATAELQA